MNIVFDLDNTITDDFGKRLRPGIIDLFIALENNGFSLFLWTSSIGERALSILYELNIRKYFKKCIYREDYDPQNSGIGKDIRSIKGDLLVDDDPGQIKYVKSIGRAGYLISPFRTAGSVDSKELEILYKKIIQMKRI